MSNFEFIELFFAILSKKYLQYVNIMLLYIIIYNILQSTAHEKT